MSTLLQSVIDPESRIVNLNLKVNGQSVNTKKKKCALKSKENIFKPQCRRELKKKLKKYKLRRDGQEDQDVLDVSQILITALKIKSPTKDINSKLFNDLQEELTPKNYLFKMGRRKQVIKEKLENYNSDAVTNKKESESSGRRDLEECNTTENTIKEHKLSQGDNPGLANEDISNKCKDKKQTNAFQLMMDSRNKSIGSNSPGKERDIDETEAQDLIFQKSIKAKRNLLLQKMAEAKGSLKKKEIDDYHEQCVKKKMEKRAERLKKMITIKKSKLPEEDSDVEIVFSEKETPFIISKKETPTNNNVHTSSSTKTLKLVNMFHDPMQNITAPVMKKVEKTKEDEAFLKKLSPSLKKKENMLCYFKKVDKEEDLDDMFDPQSVEDNPVIIKVKMTPKSKKTSKKKKLSLNKDIHNDDSLKSTDEVGIKKSPRPEKSKSGVIEEADIVDTLEKTNTNDLDVLRPRRNVKRPAKYIDDIEPSSSDEELHIFTPKKKKQNKKSLSLCIIDAKIEPQQSEALKKPTKEEKIKLLTKKNLANDSNQQKKTTKLAPIFAAKPQMDAAAMEAKQRFLSSGVPDKLKKTMEKPSDVNIGESIFHAVVHVQQNELVVPDADCEFSYRQSDNDDDLAIDEIYGKDLFKRIITSSQLPLNLNSNPVVNKTKTHDMLQKIKQSYPKFPVYRTYRMLKDKNRGEFKDCSYLDLDNSIEVINGMIDVNNESPDKLNWTDRYKAMSSKQLIGNFECIKELKKWLISWTENDFKLKKNNGTNSDSSDFYQSDTDSKDSMKISNNLLLITGPIGSGKTSIVYAVAAELAIKVLEVNASSKRTGKIMLQDLQEATQSHKVNRGKSSQENSQKSQDINSNNEKQNKIKKRGRPKKTAAVESKPSKVESKANNEVSSQPNSQDSNRTCMSLILIDDADIVFEQDDGFCSAIVQLVQSSKRPVILITSSLSCPHLQRFLQIAKIIQTRSFFPRMLGTWLDILCLADNSMCWPGLGAKILDYFNGDIRKSINFLHFHTVKDLTNDTESASQSSDLYKIDLEDETSNMSWIDREGNEEKIENCQAINNLDGSIWQCLIKEQASIFYFKHPQQLFNIWWNIPRLVNASSHSKSQHQRSNKSPKDESKRVFELDTISNVSDMISMADLYSCNEMESLTSVPWANFESHSVSEQENLEKYDRNREILDEISHSLVTGSILRAQRVLGLEQKTDLEFPGMAIKRERDRIAFRHNNVSSYLNPSAALDRRALALDYWSGCRSICRIEKSRTDCNSKRNNRFCHYLKSLNILCKSDSFDNLGKSLCSKEST